jgi:hypothetical protein
MKTVRGVRARECHYHPPTSTPTAFSFQTDHSTANTIAEGLAADTYPLLRDLQAQIGRLQRRSESSSSRFRPASPLIDSSEEVWWGGTDRMAPRGEGHGNMTLALAVSGLVAAACWRL